MRIPWLITGVVVGLWLGVWLASAVAAEMSPCEQAIAEQYRGLAADQFVPVLPATTATPSCGEQIQAVGEQVRVVNYQYNLKAQQAVVAEGEVARQREQLRQLRLENAALKAEVVKLRNGGMAPDAPAR